jgi:adenylosuccinate lyase
VTDHEVFQSPFSWRYGSPEMRRLWSEAEKRRLMRRVWLALAEAEAEVGLVSEAQLEEMRRTVEDVDIDRASEIERVTRHDVMAEIRTWAEQAPLAAPILHLGATSADVTDNVDALRLRHALRLARESLTRVIGLLADRVDETADAPTLGWTHLQPAAPTTVGYRLASSLQDFVMDLASIDWTGRQVRGKGFKGAVGTSASYAALLAGTGMEPAQLEAHAMRRLGLEAFPVTGQVYPRKLDWLALNVLAGIAASAGTLAYNVRILQSPPFGEWSEGFGPGQVGSTAMPWKRNPINAENVDSLARLVASYPALAWQNEAAMLLERTLDDSANRRVALPEAFLAADEILARTARLVAALDVDEQAIDKNLARYGPFAALEPLLMACARAGADRQEMHEVLRRHAMEAWARVASGEDNPLADALAADPAVTRYVAPDEMRQILASPARSVGDAPQRARAMARAAREGVSAGADRRPAPNPDGQPLP